MPIDSRFKDEVLAACKMAIAQKIHSLNSALDDLNEAASNETKSSAGDKYETGRAMIQQEQEKIGKQLTEAKDHQSVLERTPLFSGNLKIGPGSLVETNGGIFFIAIALGKIKVKGHEVFVISPASPMAQKIREQKENTFEINGKSYKILHIA